MDLLGLARATSQELPRRHAVAMGLALAAAGAAAWALLERLGGGAPPFPLFHVFITLAALLGGLVAGTAALLGAMLLAEALGLSDGAGIGLTLFLLTQAVIVLLCGGLRGALGQLSRVEGALSAKVAEVQALMDLAPVGIWFARAPEAGEVTCNRFAAEMLRMPPAAAVASARSGSARPPSHFVLRRDGAPVPPAELPLERALRGEESRNEELEAVFADGSSIILLSNARAVRDPSGRLIGAVAAGLDVTALKRTEAALREAVAARELLQREADHRIKNSLQLVASMLRLQRARVTEHAAAAMLDESAARIAGVAEAHAALQRSEDLLSVNAAAMVSDLCRFLARLNPAVEITCRAEGDTPLEMARAVPLGLVVTELLTNAVRHAYAPGAPGLVEVSVAGLQDGLEIEVRDHGAGMAADARRPGSLGRDIVRTLSAQIGATLQTRSAPGQGTAVVLRLAPAQSPPPVATRALESCLSA